MKKFVMAMMLLVLIGAAAGPGYSSDINIAKGCPVSANLSPNYRNTGNVLSNLTDGVYSHGRMWMQPAAVGWEENPVVSITIDLGKVQPISGVSFSTASGEDSVQWPGSLFIWVSDDSRDWRFAGDLVALSEKYGVPQAESYANYRFATHDLRTKGRYVRISAISGNSFVFCDEIEIYKGPSDLLSHVPAGKPVQDTEARTKEMYFSSRIIYRLNHDVDDVRAAVKSSKIADAEKQRLFARLDKISSRIPGINRQDSDDFECVLPIDENDAAIFSVYGSLLKSEGHPSLFAWKKDRYDFLRLTEVPKKSSLSPEISISMMRNEYRSDAVLLTNASNKPVEAKIVVEGAFGGVRPEWLKIYDMPWTDTAVGTPVEAALSPAALKDGVYNVRIPAGMTKKLWVTANSQGVSAGDYKGRLKILSSGRAFSVPLRVSVSNLKMNRPRLSFCTWEYCFKSGRYAVNERLFNDALATMRTHFVDSPWAQSTDVPTPGADSFDSNGNMVKPLDFGDFDHWIGLWPDARHYLLFLNAPTDICGFPMGSDGFNIRVGNWMKALADHMRSIGRKPEELGLMIRDEPGEESQKVIIGWANAIRAAKTGVLIFQDCNIGFSQNGYMADALKSADVSIPMIGAYYGGGRTDQMFYDSLQKSGRKMWFYQCEGPARMLDPYRYYRLEAWRCFKHGAVGMGLWAFGDTGGYKSSWNEYGWIRNEYSPLFFRPTDITEGIDWEASREGIEDYEYLSMLKDAAARTKNATLKSQAEQLMSEAVDSVLGRFTSPSERWIANSESSKADAYRLKVLRLLEKMN
jgi:hypothetical protein